MRGAARAWLRRIRRSSAPADTVLDAVVDAQPLPPRFDEAAVRREMVGVGGWCAGPLTVRDGVFSAHGWALPPLDGVGSGALLVGDTIAEAELWAGHRPDIEHLYWFWPGAASSGFIVRAPIDTSIETRLDHVRAVDDRTPVNEMHGCFWPADEVNRRELPDHVRQARVQGIGDDGVFVMEGYSAFRKITDTISSVRGGDRSGLGDVLDWGCGCGRLSRYLVDIPGVRVTGIDIDHDNVAWCAEHLTPGRFVPTDLSPPCAGLADASFDSVIGMSVMTHLREADQFAWLAELARVTRPGGIVALTVHGGATMARGAPAPALIERYRHDGFIDGGFNADLVGAVADAEAYRNVFHSRAYVESRWTERFEVARYVPGYVGNHHDLVVLRRRA